MSQPPALATLLALLLAIRDLEVTLDSDEFKKLLTIGQQIEMAPDDWDNIQADLMAMMTSNHPLNAKFQQYQPILTQFLMSVGGDILDLLPTPEELRQALQLPKPLETLGPTPGKPNRSPSKAIINDIVVPILKSDNQTQTTRYLFERLVDRLREFGDSDDNPPILPPGI